MQTEPGIFEPNRNGHDDDMMPNTTLATAPHTRSGVSREFHNLLADIEFLVKDMTQLTGEDLARTKVKLNDQIVKAKKAVETMGDTLTDQAHKSVVIANDYVKQQPWQAIGIGAAIGLVLGAVIARRA